MKELKNEIKKNGYFYLKVKVEQGEKHKVAMYAQYMTDAGIIGYEVFIVKTSKECTRKMPDGSDVLFESSEHFPSDEEFGKIAWSCRTFDDAEKKFQELLAVEPQ